MKLKSAILLIFTMMVVGVVPIRADDKNQIANIEKAAAEIAAIQTKKGADGAFSVITDCYKRELAVAKSLTRGLEACMTQDLLVSKISAAFYAKIGEEARKASGSPDPKAVLGAMVGRVMGTFRKFQLSDQKVSEFNQLVEKYGTEAYGKVRFPNAFPSQKK
jgi:hypothetical protein